MLHLVHSIDDFAESKDTNLITITPLNASTTAGFMSGGPVVVVVLLCVAPASTTSPIASVSTVGRGPKL